jgi:hypothetical protein
MVRLSTALPFASTDNAGGIYRNFEKIVIAAYRWLSENYQEGDRIYLFGEKYYVKTQNSLSKALV